MRPVQGLLKRRKDENHQQTRRTRARNERRRATLVEASRMCSGRSLPRRRSILSSPMEGETKRKTKMQTTIKMASRPEERTPPARSDLEDRTEAPPKAHKNRARSQVALDASAKASQEMADRLLWSQRRPKSPQSQKVNKIAAWISRAGSLPTSRPRS